MPSLYDYHILGSPPYADEKEKDYIPVWKELSHSTVREEHRGIHRPLVYQVGGVPQAN